MENGNMVNVWDVCNIARSLRCSAPEMAILFVLKFTSDNADHLGVHINKLSSFDSLVELYVNGTLSAYDFSYHCREILDQTTLVNTGAAEQFTQFISTSHDDIKELLYSFRSVNLHDSPCDCLTADAFLAFLAADTGWDGFCKSSTSTAKLMAELVIDENTETVYDGYCGYGTGLTYAQRKNPNIRIFGQDISANCIIVAKALQWMQFNKTAVIQEGDTLHFPLPCNKGIPTVFDTVIIDPPLAFKVEVEDIMLMPDNMLIHKELTQRRGDWLIVQHALAVLKPSGKAVVQTRMSTLFASGKAMDIRRKIIEYGYISTVIEFPAGMLPGASAPVSMLVLKNDGLVGDIQLINMASPHASKYFIKVARSNTILTDEGIQFIARTVNNREQDNVISKIFSIDAIAEKNYILTPSAYFAAPSEEDMTISPDYAMDTIKKLEKELRSVTVQLEAALADLNNTAIAFNN